ncbi:MAG: hypothetical protein ACP5E4_02505 [Candidatus Aenigmatarchaeota archaeon]
MIYIKTGGLSEKLYGERVFLPNSKKTERFLDKVKELNPGFVVPKQSSIKVAKDWRGLREVRGMEDQKHKAVKAVRGFESSGGYGTIKPHPKAYDILGYPLPKYVMEDTKERLKTKKNPQKVNEAVGDKKRPQRETGVPYVEPPSKATRSGVREEIIHASGKRKNYPGSNGFDNKTTGGLAAQVPYEKCPAFPSEYASWLSSLNKYGFLDYAFTDNCLKDGITSRSAKELSKTLNKYITSDGVGGRAAKGINEHSAKYIFSANNNSTFKRFIEWMRENVEEDWMDQYRTDTLTFKSGRGRDLRVESMTLNFLYDSVEYLRREGIMNI